MRSAGAAVRHAKGRRRMAAQLHGQDTDESEWTRRSARSLWASDLSATPYGPAARSSISTKAAPSAWCGCTAKPDHTEASRGVAFARLRATVLRCRVQWAFGWVVALSVCLRIRDRVTRGARPAQTCWTLSWTPAIAELVNCVVTICRAPRRSRVLPRLWPEHASPRRVAVRVWPHRADRPGA